MYLRKSNGKYFQIVKSFRTEGSVSQKVIKHLGILPEEEVLQIRAILRTKDKDKLTAIYKYLSTHNEAFIADSALKTTASGKTNKKPAVVAKVTVTDAESHSNKQKVFEINKDWLKKMYINEKYSISKIADICKVNRSVVRRNLVQAGIARDKDISDTKQIMAEFGFDIIDGRKVKNEYEQKMIEAMIYWRNVDGLSYDKIAKKLTEMGVKGKLGAVNWDRSIVRKMILRNSKS